MKIGAISNLMPLHSINKLNGNTSLGTVNSIKNDSVSFSGKYHVRRVDVPVEKAEFVANSLSTSTSGHRAEYLSENFTKDIVNLITLGIADYAKDKAKEGGHRPTVLIGGDTRRASRESLPEIKDTLTRQGVDVIYIKEPVPTPLLAFAAENKNIDLAVLMTASHNPWNDAGYNIVTPEGAIAGPDVTKQIADRMVTIAKIGSYPELHKDLGKVEEFDPFDMYYERISNANIDWDNIKESGLVVYYDGLQGTGGYVVPKLLEKKGIEDEIVHSQGQDGPNPTDKNLKQLEAAVKNNNDKGLVVGLSTDGDADRFGVVDEQGNYITPNDVILLVGYHLAKNKNIEGTVIRSQATSKQIDKIADKYNLDKIETPVGFKFIGGDMLNLREQGKDILVAGEESGGLTVNGHIPEKDGIIAISTIMDLIATEKKPLSQILKDVKADLGVYYKTKCESQRFTDEESKAKVMKKAEAMYNDAMNGNLDFYGTHRIDAEKTAECRKNMEHYKKGGDGYKFILTDGSTILMRKSGTEPLVKCYIEAAGSTPEEAEQNYDVLWSDLGDFFKV